MTEVTNRGPIVFFDGVCNLCNSSVQYIIKNDTRGLFSFAPLQSDIAKEFLGSEKDRYDSIVLYENGNIYFKSTAALRIAKKLRGLNKLIYPFIILPAPFRNLVYDFIARNRYRWFGKRDYCMIPTPELKERFL